MTKIELKNDIKLNAILKNQHLAQAFAKGYLKGRAATMLFDLLPSSHSMMNMEVFSGRLSLVAIDKRIHKTVTKVSCTPFWVRNLFHRFFMWASADYRADHFAKAERIAQAFNQGTVLNLDYYGRTPFVFSKKAFAHKAKPKKFTGSLITETKLNLLLDKHKLILRQGESGTHGDPLENIILGFKEGKANTTARGTVPLLDRRAENRELVHKIRAVMTLISNKTEIEQKRYMERLSSPFKSCAVGRIDIIETLYSELTCLNSFEEEIEHHVHTYKRALFERLIPKNNDPHHITGYLALCGHPLGIEGTKAARRDPHAIKPNFRIKRAFIEKFRKEFQNEFDLFCLSIVSRINNKNENNVNYGKWLSDLVNSGELQNTFSHYDESKELYYQSLNAPDDDQKDCAYFFISPAEVKQILHQFGFIEKLTAPRS